MEGMAAMARELQPGLIIANRTVGDAYEDFITPEHQIPDEPLDSPWESCLCMGGSWKYEVHDRPRPTAEILEMLVDTVSKGGNLLLGIGPTPSGEIGPEFLRGLEEVGEWMKVNSEAIHGSRAINPYREGSTRFTQKQDFVYAFLLDHSQVTLTTLQPPPGAELRLLGSDEAVSVRTEPNATHLSLPPSSGALPQPWVVRWKM
jgi:alpha-L-fucosidase